MGILDAVQSRPTRDSLFRGLPIIATRGSGYGVNSGNLSNGTDTAGTYRYMHVVTTASSDIRLVYGNFYDGATVGPNAITVKAGLEPPVTTGVAAASVSGIIPVSFNGARSVVIDPGCWAISDPIPFDVAIGQLLYTRTFVSVASAGMRWPLCVYTYAGSVEGTNKAAPGADVTDTGALATATGAGYSPVALIGSPFGRAVKMPPTVAIGGDSIAFGSGDQEHQDLGFAVRACNTASLGYINLGRPNERISDVVSTVTLSLYRYRMTLAACCSDFIDEYAVNDLINGRTLAQIQADKLVLWTRVANRGVRVWTTTCTPTTTSTDGFTTTTNQTVKSGEAVRLGLNAWVRAGCPIDPSTKAAVAVGTGGALLASSAGHPCKGYFEIADTVESARDSGFWKPGTLRAVSDAAITNGSFNLTSATAAFTSADLYKSVYVAGAGAAGAAFTATITSVASGTQVGLTAGASTTVTGAVARIGGWTTDGTHPATIGHQAMAAAVITSRFT